MWPWADAGEGRKVNCALICLLAWVAEGLPSRQLIAHLNLAPRIGL